MKRPSLEMAIAVTFGWFTPHGGGKRQESRIWPGSNVTRDLCTRKCELGCRAIITEPTRTATKSMLIAPTLNQRIAVRENTAFRFATKPALEGVGLKRAVRSEVGGSTAERSGSATPAPGFST